MSRPSRPQAAPASDPLEGLLEDLLRLPGPPGHEAPVRARLVQAWAPLADELHVTPLGSLHALRLGQGPAPRPLLLLAAHMDAIGLMVTEVVGGFVRVRPLGGFDPRVLPGQAVIVHGRRPLPGVIVRPPPACLPPDLGQGVVPIEHLLVDLGLPAAQAARLTRPGDPITFDCAPRRLGEGLLSGPGLDNRASVAALTICLRTLAGRQHGWDVVAAATVQEEITLAGGATSAFALRPSMAVAVDVTYAAGLNQPAHKTFALEGGPTNGWGPNLHPAVYRLIEQAGERAAIPLTVELTPDSSGTDAIAMQVAREGIPCGMVSIPLRYMHTPVEVVAWSDIEQAGLLLAELAAGLAPDALDGLTWG